MNPEIIERLNYDERRVYDLLRSLEDGQHLTANAIMNRLSILSHRYFYSLISNMRLQGVPVLSSKKHSNKGYWLASNRNELHDYIKEKERYINTHYETVLALKDSLNYIV